MVLFLRLLVLASQAALYLDKNSIATIIRTILYPIKILRPGSPTLQMYVLFYYRLVSKREYIFSLLISNESFPLFYLCKLIVPHLVFERLGQVEYTMDCRLYCHGGGSGCQLPWRCSIYISYQ